LRKIIFLFLSAAVIILNLTGIDAPVRAQTATHEIDETAAPGDYAYKVIKAERKKDDPRADFYFVTVNVINKSEFISGKIPEIKIVDEKEKEFSHKEERTHLEKNSSVLLSLSFEIPKTAGECRLKIYGDDAGALHSFINLSPKIIDAPNELFSAAAAGDIAKIKKALAGGARINNKNSKGETPLMLAAGKGKSEAVKFLLDKGGDSWAKNNYDEAALFYAIYAKNYDCVKLLLEKGSDTKYPNYKGRTALDEAKKKYNKAIIEIVRLYTDKITSAIKQKSDSK